MSDTYEQVIDRTRIVNLSFRSPTNRPVYLHIGSDRKGVENASPIIHSDTLFSAICHAWQVLYGGADLTNELLKPLRDGSEPPIVISSAFPRGGPNWFVPRPLLPFPGQESQHPAEQAQFLRYYRRLKDVFFLDLELLPDWLEELSKTEATDRLRFYQRILDSQRSFSHSVIIASQPANQIGSDSALTNPFYRGKSVNQSHESLFFFLIRYSQSAWANQLDQKLDTILKELADLGIGGERSVGMGQFLYRQPERPNAKIRRVFRRLQRMESHYLLSLYHPRKNEQDQLHRQLLGYNPILRKGWFLSPTGYQQKRNGCWMLAEGSVWRGKVPPRGKLLDVSPDSWCRLKEELDTWHPIYRNGIAFWFGPITQE